MPKLSVNLTSDLPAGVSAEFIRIITSAVNSADLPNTEGQINLKLVDDKEIASLNKKYAGIDAPTDVLSFVYEGGDELGDIAISLETAKRQARDTLADEIGLLLIHGLLHVLGYDHQTHEEQVRLDEMQGNIAGAAGITYRKMEWKQ